MFYVARAFGSLRLYLAVNHRYEEGVCGGRVERVQPLFVTPMVAEVCGWYDALIMKCER